MDRDEGLTDKNASGIFAVWMGLLFRAGSGRAGWRARLRRAVRPRKRRALSWLCLGFQAAVIDLRETYAG
jgi:hypothetical protein